MYSTKWCGYCQRLKRDLKDVGIDFEEVDIELVPEAASHEGHEATAEPSYRTTRKFLECFRLESIDDLPEPTEPPK